MPPEEPTAPSTPVEAPSEGVLPAEFVQDVWDSVMPNERWVSLFPITSPPAPFRRCADSARLRTRYRRRLEVHRCTITLIGLLNSMNHGKIEHQTSGVRQGREMAASAQQSVWSHLISVTASFFARTPGARSVRRRCPCEVESPRSTRRLPPPKGR